MLLFISILFGILYANVVEYCIHRYLFHGLGRSGSSIFAFHLRVHHMISRRDGFVDMRASHNELIGLPILVLLHSPLLLILPTFFYTVTAYAIMFVAIHNTLHHYPRFAQKYYWWHWNHHMQNQNKSWGVVLPLTDIVVGTLEDPRTKIKDRPIT